MNRIIDRLRQCANDRFVGRAGELALFRSALHGAVPESNLFLLHGPGGSGKTAMLEQMRMLSEEAGYAWHRLDARNLDGTAHGLAQVLCMALGAPAAGTGGDLTDALRHCAGQPRRVLAIDTFEQLAHLEPWLRDAFLGHLPARTIVILSGRLPPGRFWLTDPVWRHGCQAIALGNLDGQDVRALLPRLGIDARHAEAMLALTYGHPLALMLLADIVKRDDAVPAALAPDLILQLLACFADDLPTPRHRDALMLCAMARATTQDLLAALVDDASAQTLFAWLEALGFVERGPHGLFPHDLVRDAVVADARWRTPDEWARMGRRLVRHHLARLQASPQASRPHEVGNLLFLQRMHPVLRRFFDFGAAGSVTFERATPLQADGIAAMFEREAGPTTAALARRWLGQPLDHSWIVMDGDRKMMGAMLCLDLARMSPQDIEQDDGLAQAWRWMRRQPALQPGDKVLCARMIAVDGGWADAIPALNALQACMGHLWMTMADLAIFISVTDSIAHWAPMMNHLDFHEAEGASFSVDGRAFHYFAHDWRLRGLPQWIELLTGHVSDGTLAPIAAPGAQDADAASPLSRHAFEQALRDALKHWTDPQRLAINPLLRCRLLRDDIRQGEPPALAMQHAIARALSPWRTHARDRKFFQAIEMTYLKPAGSQELAAERLGLPFGTYRYQLGTGVSRLASLLWSSEMDALGSTS